MTNQFPRLCCTLVALSLGIGVSDRLLAAAWDWQSQAVLSGRTNDNPTLRIENLPDGTPSPQEIVSATSLNGSVEMDLIRSTPNSRIEITPRVSRSYYPDEDFKDLENTNWFIFADGIWNQQRTSFGVNMRYEDVSLLSNEDQGGDGTGGSLFRVDDTRALASIAPNFTWRITERDSLQASASYSEVDYALDFTGRADGDFSQASLGYQRALSQRQSLGLTAFVNQSRSEQLANPSDPFVIENDFDAVNLNVNYTFNAAEDFSVSLRYGRQETETTNSGQQIPLVELNDEFAAFFGDCAAIVDIGDEPPSAQFPLGRDIYEFVDCKSSLKSNTYALDIDKAFELSRVGFTISQRITPNSAGSPTERIQASVSYERDLSERLTFDALATAYEQETVNTASSARKNTNFRGELRIDWVFTRNWALGAEYIYRYRDNATDADISTGNFQSFGDADSNEFGFFIRYFIERSEL